MFWLIIMVIVAALIWLEIIPLRKWYYLWKARAVSNYVRRSMDFFAWLDKLL